MQRLRYSGPWGWPEGRDCFHAGQRGFGTRAWIDGSVRRWRGQWVRWRRRHGDALQLMLLSESARPRAAHVLAFHHAHRRLQLPSPRPRATAADVRRLWACRACCRVTPQAAGAVLLMHFLRCPKMLWRADRRTSARLGCQIERTDLTTLTGLRCATCTRPFSERALDFIEIRVELHHVDAAEALELRERVVHRKDCPLRRC